MPHPKINRLPLTEITMGPFPSPASTRKRDPNPNPMSASRCRRLAPRTMASSQVSPTAAIASGTTPGGGADRTQAAESSFVLALS